MTDAHPGPGAIDPREARRTARAGTALQLTALATTAPLAAAIGWASGGPTLAVATVASLVVGVAIGSVVDLDRFFAQIPGIVVAITAPMLLGVGVVLTSEGSVPPATGPLLLQLGAVLWGLDWRRAGRLRAQAFLMVVPLWLALFRDPTTVEAAAVVAVALGVLASLALAARDEQGGVPRLSSQPPAAPRTSFTAADLARAVGVALVVGGLAWFLLDGRSVVPPDPPDVGDRLSFGSPGGEGTTPGVPPTGSPSGGGGGASGDLPSGGGGGGGVTGDPGTSLYDGGTGSGSAGGGGGGLGLGEGGEGFDLDGDGTVDGFDLDGDGLMDGFDLDGDGTIDEAADAGEDPEADDGGDPPWLLVAGLVLAAVAAALALWWWRSRERPPARAEPSWAEVTVARLGREGARRGRPRAPPESVLAYVAALADDTLPDARLLEVGRILSAALFGGREATAEQRVWVDDALDAILAAHPAPSRVSTRTVRAGRS